MLARFLQATRLRRVERRLKKLHHAQKKVRERLADAEAEARKGDASAKARVERLEAERERLVEQVAGLTQREKALKGALGRA